MAETALSPSRKRPYPDDLDNVDIATTPLKAPMASSIDYDTPSTPLSSVLSEPPASPILLQSLNQVKSVPAPADSSKSQDAPPAKKPKLTAEDKERLRLEKEAKEKAKQEAKAQKEEERRIKEEARKEKKEKADEERRVKEEALRAKREQVEEKKRAKEMEQAKKDEEKAKKERSQLRLNAFFGGMKPGASPSKPKGTSVSPEKERQKSMSVEPRESYRESPCPCPAAQPQPSVPEYKKYFFPFELPSHAALAPTSRESLSINEIEAKCSMLDSLTASSAAAATDGQILIDLKERAKQHGAPVTKMPTVQSIITLLNGSSDDPIDLTNNGALGQQPLQLLHSVPMKYLHFHEDVRPPYHGTFTKVQHHRDARRFARNPFHRGLPQTDYEYDSEAEWEEPEEGEDLGSEIDEDNESVDDGEDMEGFLDDEEDEQIKRRQISSDLEPVNSGIWWEDAKGVSRKADDENEVSHDLSEFRMGFLLEPCPKTIDPFSTSYWETEPAKAAPAPPSKDSQKTLTGMRGIGLMNPPRAPLGVRPNSVINSTKTQSADQAKTGKSAGKATGQGAVSKASDSQKRTVPPELMQEFKAEINGSDLTKIAMIEALKKKFPKIPKDAIQNTLGLVAERTGKGHAKTWTLR